jgi:sugar lactone lactonase YvrE
MGHFRRMGRLATIFSCALPGVFAAQADFVAGRIYVSASSGPCDEPEANPRIWEFDPATGNSRVFAELPDDGHCGFITGLTFTPDGSRLRASVYNPSAILEFDSDGNFTTALGPPDGVFGPLGGNNIAYDRDDNFYVLGGLRILRFPAEGGPGEIYGDNPNGIIGPGPIALAPNGNLFYGPANAQVRTIWRFTGPGQSAIFDTLPSNTSLASLAVDSAGNVFASTDSGIYRYSGGDPATRTWISPVGGAGGYSAMTLAPDESALFVSDASRISSVNPVTGESRLLVTLPVEPEFENAGYGIAVAIPEPAALACFVLLFAFRPFRRSIFCRIRNF